MIPIEAHGDRPRGPEEAVNFLLLFALTLSHEDFRNLVVLGDNRGRDTLLADVREHLVLQTTFDVFARGHGFLGVLVELALDHLHLGIDGQGLRFTPLALPLVFLERDLAVIHLGDEHPDFVGEGNAHTQNQDDRCTDDFPQHAFSLL